MEKTNKLNNFIINLAREAVKEYILEGRRKEEPENLPDQLKKRRGVFVSLKKNGKLRGCIGTTEPTQENIAQEIISNAISSCSHDPRFVQVQPDEIDNLDISVDILGKKEPVSDRNELDPEKYGIIVEGGHQTGLLLPDLEGVDTVKKQIEIARKKAGLTAEQDIDIYRFQVTRFE